MKSYRFAPTLLAMYGVTGWLWVAGVHAAEVIPDKLTPALASEAALAAIDACQAKGLPVSATVVDHHGRLHVLQRGESASLDSLATSQQRALRTSKFALSNYAERVDGGVLLRVDKAVIGAIGVGGASSIKQDEHCAQLGASRFLERRLAFGRGMNGTRGITVTSGWGDWLVGMRLFYRG
ncbi:heme-binding protein [Chitinivorax sp. B]|uniref:GlcG/HbpS family heme-binding protein n=1 Tax=Chitinivorax sp. B TaxID=2502235 RepID=UPI001485814F|nr:heme-binding protein [Chitinivorax sp. B]